MTGRDRQPEGTYGFARGPRDGSPRTAEPALRLVHARETPPRIAPEPSARRRGEAVSPSPRQDVPKAAQHADDERWLVRPKALGVAGEKGPPGTAAAEGAVEPGSGRGCPQGASEKACQPATRGCAAERPRP